MLTPESAPNGSGEPLERCGVCRNLRVLGNCDFGKGNPFFINTPHCRECCTLPDRTHWRSLAEIEGRSGATGSRVRRILRSYASGYSRLLGRIRRAGHGRMAVR